MLHNDQEGSTMLVFHIPFQNDCFVSIRYALENSPLGQRIGSSATPA